MPEQEASVEFPAGGVHVACEYSRQPDGTTPVGTNVRALDQATERLRGGSRPGLARFINETVNGDALIQHLTVLVDPTVEALGADDDGLDEEGNPLPGTTEDTSTNNLRTRNPIGTFGTPRRYRTGGSGRQPNRNVPQNNSQPIEFVQAKRVQPGIIAPPEFSIVFDEQPLNNALIVVVINAQRIASTDALPEPTATNADLGDYENVGVDPTYTADVFSDGGVGSADHNQLTMLYRIANGGAGEQEIIISKGPEENNVIYEAIALEYRYASGTSPKGDFDKAEDDTSSTTLTSAAVNPNGTAGQLVIAAFVNDGATLANVDGQNGRAGVTGAPISANVAIVDKTGVSGSADTTLTVEATSGESELCSIICVFHK